MLDSLSLFLIAGAVAVAGLSLAGLLSFYRKCGPKQAMIITGMRTQDPGQSAKAQTFKIISGGGGAFVLPLVQQVNFLSLEVLDLSIHVEHAAEDKKHVTVEGIAQVKVIESPEAIARAAESCLGKSSDSLGQTVLAPIEQALVQLLDVKESGELADGLIQLSDQVKRLASPELEKLGFEIASVSIQNIRQT